MLSTDSKSSDCVGMRSPSLKKRTFLRHKSLVHFCSCLGTLEYSQDLQAKKAAPMVSCVIDISVSVTWHFASSLRTANGRALCCYSLGLSFLNARKSLDKRMLSSLSTSFVGFCLPVDWKVFTTFEMVPLTVPSANVLKRELEKLSLLTAMTNAPSKTICSCLLRLSMNMSWHPIERQYTSHLAQVQDSSSCVPPVTARSQKSCCSEISQELISLGSGDILKCISICCGKKTSTLKWCGNGK